jgi:undecaprenyl-diphosphatase uppP
MDFIEILKAIVQGIVQGITEWLPISSTGHILLLDTVWPMQVSKEFFEVFKVVIQLGSILAVVVLYFHKLNPFSGKKSQQEKRDTWSLWGKVLVASIPAGVAGILLNDLIDNTLSLPAVIAAALIVYGIAFLWMESRKKEPRIRSFQEMSYKSALGIGVFQMLALIPGTSRSGSTILGATLFGASRPVAAEFSFFMAIPVMLGASALKVLKFVMDGLSFTSGEWATLIIATVVSFLVSLIVIRFLMSFIKKHDFKPFGWYRIALGALVIVLLLTGVMSNTVHA